MTANPQIANSEPGGDVRNKLNAALNLTYHPSAVIDAADSPYAASFGNEVRADLSAGDVTINMPSGVANMDGRKVRIVDPTEGGSWGLSTLTIATGDGMLLPNDLTSMPIAVNAGAIELIYVHDTGRWVAPAFNLAVNLVDIRAYGAKTDGSDTTPAILASIAAQGVAVIPPGRFSILTPLTTQRDDALVFQNGELDVQAQVTIYGPIEGYGRDRFIFPMPTDYNTSLVKIRHENAPAGNFPWFSSTEYVGEFVREVHALWFREAGEVVDPDPNINAGDDRGSRINLAWRAGGPGTRVLLNGGAQVLATSAIMHETVAGSNVSVEGTGHQATNLVIPANANGGAGIVGIDASLSDESVLYNLKVSERTSKVSCAIALGGTSLIVDRVWVGNAGEGFLIQRGAGGQVLNSVAEHCTRAIVGGPGYQSIVASSTGPGGGLVDWLFQGGIYYSNNYNLWWQRVSGNTSNSIKFVGVTFKVADIDNVVLIDDGDGLTDPIEDYYSAVLGRGFKSFMFSGCTIREAVGRGVLTRNAAVFFSGCMIEANGTVGIEADGEATVVMDGGSLGNSVSAGSQVDIVEARGGKVHLNGVARQAKSGRAVSTIDTTALNVLEHITTPEIVVNDIAHALEAVVYDQLTNWSGYTWLGPEAGSNIVYTPAPNELNGHLLAVDLSTVLTVDQQVMLKFDMSAYLTGSTANQNLFVITVSVIWEQGVGNNVAYVEDTGGDGNVNRIDINSIAMTGTSLIVDFDTAVNADAISGAVGIHITDTSMFPLPVAGL